jgi:hypothetical protein
LRSVFFASTARRSVLSLDVSEKRFDSRGSSNGVVFLELDFRRNPQPQLARNA